MAGFPRIEEKFPISLGVLFFWGVDFLTLPFVALSVDSTPILSQKALISLTMLLTGSILLVFIAIVFSRGYDKNQGSLALVTPDKPFQGFTKGQAFVTIGGFLLLTVFQLFVNQAFFGPALASYQTGTAIITPGPATATLFKVDQATSEEALMGSFTIGLWLILSYVVKVNKLVAAGITLPVVGSVFTWIHYYVLGTNVAGLIFVFGARLILSGTLLATVYYARKTEGERRRKILMAAALSAPYFQHDTWNLVT